MAINYKGKDFAQMELAYALPHWSFEFWQRERMVCDIQGSGHRLSDMQILDQQ
jgi:hypothetical protein